MKKKKLTINKLALGNLKQRRKQYTILIIGIILAMVFSSGTLFFLFSSAETYVAQLQKEQGLQSAIIYTEENDEKFYRDAVDDNVIESYGLAHIIGFAYGRDGEENLGTAVAWLDDKAKQLSNQIIIEGVYPVHENEIAIEKTALLKLGLDAEIGSEINLKLMAQNGVNYMGTVDKTYTLTGILHDKKSYLIKWYDNLSYGMFIPAAIVADGSQTEIGGKELLAAYITIDESDSNAWSDFHDYMQENSKGYEELQQYEGFSLKAMNAISENSSYGFAIAAVLVLASCVAIVNAFNTNLKERRKQIGLLRAVGATKKQIVKVYGREALIISIICAPISIAISYGLVRLLISAINEEAVITKSIVVLPIIALICIAVTMFAAMIPLISASGITPMQAIRNTNLNYKIRARKIKSQKEFYVPSHLAKRSAALYKSGKIAVSIMLTIMILFSFQGFTTFHEVESSVSYNYEYDYELYDLGESYFNGLISSKYSGMSEAERRELDAYPYFSSVISKKARSIILNIDEYNDYLYTVGNNLFWSYENLTYDNFREQFINGFNEEYKEYKNRFAGGNDILFTNIESFEESLIERLQDKLLDGELDFGKLASGEEVILVAPQNIKWAININTDSKYSGYSGGTYFDNDPIQKDLHVVLEGECPYKVGDKLTLTFIDYKHEDDWDSDPENYSREDKEVTIGAIIHPVDARGNFYEMGLYNPFYILTTHSGMNSLSEKTKYLTVQMSVDDNIEIDEDIDETISAYLEQYANKYSADLDSSYAQNRNELRRLYSLFVSLIALITIGFMICGSIVNNSLTAMIRENKKAIGTLRAVGADMKVLVSSYIRQLLSMFAYGYAIGFGGVGVIYISMLITYAYEKSLGYDTTQPVFYPWETLALCAILFAICSFNLWSKIRKEMKNSIVDNIREL
ncbi:MAG: ABC transporter permease [Eubacterium sp.]|nr:ABC transporter permease [Eubacterium sp.]